MNTPVSASASASISASASASASATSSSLFEARKDALLRAQSTAYFSLAPPTHPLRDLSSANIMSLSCIDFRFVDDAGYYMNLCGNCNNYDQFALAGASLGYNGIPDYENWTICCDQTIQLSYDLHDISEITIFDHLDCGGYALVYTPEQLAGDGEYNLHVENLNKAEETIKSKFKFIKKVTKQIINLDYEVIVIP